MSFDYAAKRLTAERLIAKFGGAGSFVLKGTKGGYDAYGDETPDTDDVVIDGVITPLLSYSQDEVDGDSILSTDSYVFFHSDESPEINYVTTVNDETYRAMSVNKIDSVDGINVFRKIQLRK